MLYTRAALPLASVLKCGFCPVRCRFLATPYSDSKMERILDEPCDVRSTEGRSGGFFCCHSVATPVLWRDRRALRLDIGFITYTASSRVGLSPTGQLTKWTSRRETWLLGVLRRGSHTDHLATPREIYTFTAVEDTGAAGCADARGVWIWTLWVRSRCASRSIAIKEEINPAAKLTSQEVT